MNITNLDIIQATMDIFFCLFCVVMLISIKANDSKQKSMKFFLQLFLIASILFLGEALAYIFRGNVSTFDIIITHASNCIVFVMNVAMANTYVRYVNSVFSDSNVEINHKYIKVANVFSCINLLIIAINFIYPWMYYFDNTNSYHRNNMWYVYTIISIIIIFIGAIIAIQYRKNLNIQRLSSILIFALIPVIAIVAQLFVYGISIANLGLGIGVFVMFAAYIYDWSHDSYENMKKIRNHRLDSVLLFVIMLFSMSISIIACTSVIQNIAKENSEIQSKTIAQMVSATVENEFIKPITVSQTLSQDVHVRSYIQTNSREEAESFEDEMTKHLIATGSEFGYQMVFVVADKTRAYYTYDGISKFLDVDNDAHDIWYKDYLESNKNYILNVDTDENNNWDLTVFVNYGIHDANGDVLGACGVGVDMDKLVDLVSNFEENYDIKIDLVNREGLIQIDSDGSLIENEYLDNSYFDKVSNADFYYQLSDGCCYMTKYLDELDWYIVIKDNNPVKLNTNRVIFPIVIIFIAGVIIMTAVFIIVGIRQRRAEEAYNNSYEVSIKDGLTGLYNRRGYEMDCNAIEKENIISKHSIIMMDLNGLKAANDKLGHEAGDELIIGAARCMENAFSSIGNIYRVGGDEFVAIINAPKENLEAAVSTLDYLTSNFKGKYISELSISKGVVICSEHPELSLTEAKELADKLMYEDKDEYYRRTGKNRRKV